MGMVPATRRRFLATAGTALLGGCLGFGTFGNDRPRGSPDPFLTEPGDWSRPDHDPANTNAAPERAAPDAVGGSPDWTVDVETDGVIDVSRPVVADGVVYLALANEDDRTEVAQLLAFDAHSGEERWSIDVRWRSSLFPPVVAGETVLWGDPTLRALNAADGSERWIYEGRQHDGAPLAAHGHVFTLGPRGDTGLVALDPRNGEPVWDEGTGDSYWSLLGVGDRSLYVTRRPEAAERGELRAIDPRSGATRWLTQERDYREVTVGPAHLFATGGGPDERVLAAVAREGGETAWSVTADLKRRTSDGMWVNGTWTVAALAKGVVVEHRDFHGESHDVVEARRADTGDSVWTETRTGPGSTRYLSPVVAGDRVYLVENHERGDGTEVRRLRVLGLRSGEERSRTTLSGRDYGRPIIADGRILLTSRPGNGVVRLESR